MGTKLLAKMGWKQGQGIGPRAKKSEKNRLHKFRKKIYNVLEASSLEQADPDSESDSDSNFASLKYAPNDYEPFLLSPKTNFFGIGYQGLQKKIIFGKNLMNFLDVQK